MQSQVLYGIPITSILGRLALVPVGDTARRPARFLEQPLIQSPMMLMEIDGGMSALLPEVDSQSIKRMALLPPWQEGKILPK